MSNEQRDEQPKFEDRPVPFWIPVMWVLGILWVVVYIIQGLQHTPATW